VRKHTTNIVEILHPAEGMDIYDATPVAPTAEPAPPGHALGGQEADLDKSLPSNTYFDMKPLFRTTFPGVCPNRLKSDFLSLYIQVPGL
jgi:hypothetical protein